MSIIERLHCISNHRENQIGNGIPMQLRTYVCNLTHTHPPTAFPRTDKSDLVLVSRFHVRNSTRDGARSVCVYMYVCICMCVYECVYMYVCICVFVYVE